MKNRSLSILLVFLIFVSISEGQKRIERFIQTEFSVGVLDFLDQNEKKFLSLTSLDKNHIEVTATLNSLYRDSKLRHHIRSRKLEIEDVESIHRFNQDTLVIVTSSNSKHWKSYLSMISKTKIMSCIVVCIGDIPETKEDLLNSYIEEMSENMFFYWMSSDLNSPRVKKLDQTVSLKNSKYIIKTPIKLDRFGRIIVEKDLRGLHINCSTLPWYPYFQLKRCKGKNGTNCNGEGYLADVMDIMGKRLNFSWSCDAEPNGNWGHLETISGPKNSSGFWGGVQGLVTNGSYPLCVSIWSHLYHRFGIFDFVNVGSSFKEIVAYYPTPPTFDPTLFFRPFPLNVWALISIAYLSAFLLYQLSTRITIDSTNENRPSFSVSKLIFFVAWITHFLILGFYDGALTMFFADEVPALFSSKMDIMKAYPNWKLHFRRDDDLFMMIQIHADDGDEVYQKYAQVMKDSPNELLFDDIGDGIQRMENGQNGIIAGESTLRLYFKENPSEVRPTIIPYQEMFHVNLVLTPNSPLYPYFSAVALEMNEQGIFDILERKWHGKKLEPEYVSSLHRVVLSLGQTILMFLLLGIAISVSVFILAIEIWWDRMMTSFDKEKATYPTLETNEKDRKMKEQIVDNVENSDLKKGTTVHADDDSILCSSMAEIN